jgi:PAS domain S-box-containing protein
MKAKRTVQKGRKVSGSSPASGTDPGRSKSPDETDGSERQKGSLVKIRKDKGKENRRKTAEVCFPAHHATADQEQACSAEEIIQELQDRQIELEMQNEALLGSRIAIEESRDRYAELYEFAPVGYLILTKDAIIQKANLTIAAILGVDRRRLIGCSFAKCIVRDDSETWNRHFNKVLMTTDKHTCELHLEKSGGQAAVSQVESIRMERGGAEQVILVAISDITDRTRTEENLVTSNRALNELKAAYQTIACGQIQFRRNEMQLTEALAEKEALLSEIHHRVKNNLTAFISLLSLNGACDDTGSARELRKDLQNRARSMALIHETLYQTRKFSSVEMELYLTTLVDQIAASYTTSRGIRTVVIASDASLDLSRATTAGLIVNELVTNSFKYAFPPGFDCMAERGEPCTIRVSFILENGSYRLMVADNGIGLPGGFDPLASRSLGLRLVNFLAHFQLRAETTYRTGEGTEFMFQLHQTGECA